MGRPRPPLSDLLLAGGLALLGAGQLALEGASGAALVLVLGMTLPVALRRTHPVLGVAVASVSLLVAGGLGEDVTSQGYAAILAFWVLLYSVGRHGRGAQPVLGLVVAWAASSPTC